MPREVLEFRVVVASPSDLFETRKAVFNVIHELNRSLEIQRVAIRGLGWEEYATPGILDNAQSVINEQILKEYDILIALFATKLGTPTANAASGTVEEIENAIANTENEMGKHRVQVYFRDRIESTSSISIEELRRVVDYQRELQQKGCLYDLFKTDEELQQKIRVNLQRPIVEFLQKRALPAPDSANQIYRKPATVASPIQQTASEVTAEFGLLDYAEKAEEAIKNANASINRMAELMQEIGTETNARIADVEAISAPNVPAREKKSVINRFADFLKSKGRDLKREAAIARQNFEIYTSALIMVIGIEREYLDSER